MTNKTETYISTDIETDGPIPGPNSMLSFGSAAFQGGKMISTFSANLVTLPSAAPDPRTDAFWKDNPKAYAATRIDLLEPAAAMKRYVQWVRQLPGSPVFVAYPAGFDFLFMYWYMIKFAGESPFSFSALDMKTYAMATLGCGYRESTKRRFPRRWFSDKKHSHVALDDAIEQGEMFCKMLAEQSGQTNHRQ